MRNLEPYFHLCSAAMRIPCAFDCCMALAAVIFEGIYHTRFLSAVGDAVMHMPSAIAYPSPPMLGRQITPSPYPPRWATGTIGTSWASGLGIFRMYIKNTPLFRHRPLHGRSAGRGFQ